MNLADIRRKTAYDPNAQPTLKAATRTWLRSQHHSYPLALTLTLKQKIVETTTVGSYTRKTTRADCARTAQHFTQKLNREVFGKRAADKFGKTLTYLIVIEGERSSKNLHLHFAIGNLPKHIRLNQFDALVARAKLYVENIDAQYKVDLADSGWMDYMCKEVGTKDTDNVLWHLA